MITLKEQYYNKFGFKFNWYSNDGNDLEGNLVHIHIAWVNWWIAIPRLLKARENLVFPDWDAETVKRLGRDYYTSYIQRVYGFSVLEEGVHVHYGIQPGSWSRDDPENSDHTKVLNYPWNYEHVRWDAYFVDGTYASTGNHFRKWWERNVVNRTRPDTEEDQLIQFKTIPLFEFEQEKLQKWRFDSGDYTNWSGVTTPRPIYTFKIFIDPYDGQEIVTRINIEEREWIRGKWAWLRSMLKYIPLFRKVQRCIDLEFIKEVGSRKGSWKGGTIGMGYQMLKDETLDQAWERFVHDPKQIRRFKQR